MDYNSFEQLSGIELGIFVSDLIKKSEVDASILEYYQNRGVTLDGPHLEMMILFLEKLGTFTAVNEVSKLLDHPTKSVRYQAAQVITNATSLDEHAMAKVIAVLSIRRYPDDIIDIRNALSHGGNEEARMLARRFIDQDRPSKSSNT